MMEFAKNCHLPNINISSSCTKNGRTFPKLHRFCDIDVSLAIGQYSKTAE